jgi:ectoine hydroxylase-related dioxygenase (phytanoyl-CoA dioxygenase family)
MPESLDAYELLLEEGYAILPNLLDAETRAAIGTTLEALERDRPMGRNDFEGRRSHRVYSLAGKGSVFLALAEHPAIVALLDRFLLPNWLLSTMQSIRLHPGESEQPWHSDDGFYVVSRPQPAPLGLSVIWAIEEFTADNGATELIPRSHRWGEAHPNPAGERSFVAEMPAGSALVFDAALWHRGGANRSPGTRLAVSPQYCQPFLRPQESQLLIVPPEAARACSPRARSMLGYSIHPPFIGQVDGMHPLRTIDPSYRANKTADGAIADRVLADPYTTMKAPARSE